MSTMTSSLSQDKGTLTRGYTEFTTFYVSKFYLYFT